MREQLKQLKELESFELKKDQDYKEYYSSLTGIVRRYLEEDAKVSALESTSDSIITARTFKNQGNSRFKTQTLNNLKNILKTADLVKFAKSIPRESPLYKKIDLLVGELVIETNEVLPELSEEELREQEGHKLLLIKKKRRKKLYIGGYYFYHFNSILIFFSS